MLAFNLSLQLVLLIGIGFVIYRAGIVDDNFDKSTTSLLLNVALPCLIINSFNVPFSQSELHNCLVLLAMSIVLMAVWFAVGQLTFKLCRGGHTGRMLRFAAVFTNFSFVGVPVMEVLYGQIGVLYFVVFTAPVRMVYYSGAKPLLTPKGTSHAKLSFTQHLKGWISPPVIAVLLGFALYITQLQLPSFLEKTISSIGAICSPLGMIICGISLGKNNLKKLLGLKYLKLPLLRNIIMPAVTLACVYFLPIDPLVAKVVVSYAALPVASLLSAFTLQYDPQPEALMESSGGVLLSIMLCSVTIPLWTAVLEKLYS